MSLAQKWSAGLIAIGLVTALTLPGRHTAPVIDAIRGFITGLLHTSITGMP